jgi:uncharacterized Tic20 family protein
VFNFNMLYIMWYLVSFVLLFIGCVLCCAGELWAFVLYLPFVVALVVNEVRQGRKVAKRRE